MESGLEEDIQDDQLGGCLGVWVEDEQAVHSCSTRMDKLPSYMFPDSTKA